MGRIKNLDEIKAMVRARTGKRNTFRHAKVADVESVLANLTSKDPELWAKEWSRVAKPYEEQAIQFEKDGRFEEAREAYVQAYAYYATGRYPTPHRRLDLQRRDRLFRNAARCRCEKNRHHGPQLRRLLVGQDGPRRSQTIARIHRLGRRRAFLFSRRLAARVDQRRKLPDGPRNRPLPPVRRGKLRRFVQTLVGIIAQRPRLARQTIVSDAHRQRQG
jgi:hypothetical protein